jgi:hypothetical protein
VLQGSNLHAGDSAFALAWEAADTECRRGFAPHSEGVDLTGGGGWCQNSSGLISIFRLPPGQFAARRGGQVRSSRPARVYEPAGSAESAESPWFTDFPHFPHFPQARECEGLPATDICDGRPYR